MSSINPFSGYVAQGSQVERAQSADKVRAVRRAQTIEKNIAARDDQLEHQVENSDAVSPAHDQPRRQDGKPRQRRPDPAPDQSEDGDPPRLDVTA